LTLVLPGHDDGTGARQIKESGGIAPASENLTFMLTQETLYAESGAIS